MQNAQVFKNKTNKHNLLKTNDLIDLGLIGRNDSSKLRKIVSENFHLGFTNGKTLLKRLNMLEISKEQIIEVLKHAN